MTAAKGLVAKQKPPPPLDTGWAWMIVIGMFINAFFMVGTAKSIGLLMIAFKDKFGVTVAEAAMTMSVAGIIYAFGAPTAILFGERFTSQRVVFIGGLVAMVGISISSLAYSMVFIWLTFGICFGIGNSCLYGNGLVMVNKYFRRRRSLAMGLALSGSSVGQFCLPPIIEFLLENYSLSGTLLIIAALYCHSCVAGCLFRPIEQYGPEKVEEVKRTDLQLETEGEALDHEFMIPGPETPNGKLANGDLVDPPSYNQVIENGATAVEENHQSGELDEEDNFLERKAMLASNGSVYLTSLSVQDVSQVDDSAHTIVVKPKVPWFKMLFDFSVLRSRITVFFTIVSFLTFVGFFNFIIFLPGILLEKGFKDYEKAMLLSMCGGGDLIARIITGFVADFNLVARYKIKAMACILCGIDIFIFMYADTFAWLAVHCLLYGMFGGAYVCLTAVVLVDFVGLALMAKNLAVVMLIQGTGAAVGQPFLGWIRDESGVYDGVIAFCSVTLILGGIMLFFYPFIRRMEEKRLEQEKGKTIL